MTFITTLKKLTFITCFGLLAMSASAQMPAPVEGSYLLKNFRFHTGEVMPELRMNFTTVGVVCGDLSLT